MINLSMMLTMMTKITMMMITYLLSLDQLLTGFLAAGLTPSSLRHQYSEDCHNPVIEHHIGLYIKVTHTSGNRQLFGQQTVYSLYNAGKD